MADENPEVSNAQMVLFCRNDQNDELHKLLEEGNCDINFKDVLGSTAAHHAAARDSVDCLKILVEHDGINLNIQNSNGDTATHRAVACGSVDCLEILVDRDDIDLNIQNRNRDTPLHLAAQYTDNPEEATYMVKLLLARGAIPSIKNDQSLKPADLVPKDRADLKEVLKTAEAEEQLDDDDILDEDCADDIDDEDDQPSD